MKRLHRFARAPLILIGIVLGHVWARSPSSRPRTCYGCHPNETKLYLASAMGNSLIAPAPVPAGRVNHAPSGSLITVQQENGGLVHTLLEQGLTARYPVRYQIGGALMGRSYLVQIGSSLFESPISWFNSFGWDLSPGYAHDTLLDFDRPIQEQCLFCHSGSSAFEDIAGRRLVQENLTSISCGRCHGDTARHIAHPSAKNVINPSKLTGPARDSICEQCHLEGAGRVLNPGKTWKDFHAGEATESTFATYILRNGSNFEVKAVSQTEQLARSHCARSGKLLCGSCHNPHKAVGNRGLEVRAICLSCHSTLSSADHPAGQSECTSCHMPRSPTTDITHAAVTDHRLLRRPAAEPLAQSGSAAEVIAWREPALAVRERDRALAMVLIGFSKKEPLVASNGAHLLQAMPQARLWLDGAALSDLEGLALQGQLFTVAVRFGRRIVELQPQSAKARL